MKINTTGWHKYMGLPALLLFATFFLLPFVRGVGLSLTDWNGFSKPTFIGFSNFIAFFSDERALRDVRTTVLFALASAPLLNLVGLALALLLNKGFRGRVVVRGLLYMPAVISPMIMGSIWYLLLQPKRGLFSILLERVNLSSEMNWMLDGNLALLVLVSVNVWQYAGMTMVIYLAGLQAIPSEHYEAASVEGATSTQIFARIVFPQLLPSLKINSITNIIGSLSVFDVILALTDGGPGYDTESLSIYIMRMSWGNRGGYSTAVAMILFFIILVPVLLALLLFRRTEGI
ncbi:MAG: sugar ABC transporter permease [Sphaerochaeta sp.]|jgi:raffinose/stachyose/melibiose transport system permease protein|nr:sugar ABC transporter permease [Sphaerochaeta sp.]